MDVVRYNRFSLGAQVVYSTLFIPTTDSLIEEVVSLTVSDGNSPVLTDDEDVSTLNLSYIFYKIKTFLLLIKKYFKIKILI